MPGKVNPGVLPVEDPGYHGKGNHGMNAVGGSKVTAVGGGNRGGGLFGESATGGSLLGGGSARDGSDTPPRLSAVSDAEDGSKERGLEASIRRDRRQHSQCRELW